MDQGMEQPQEESLSQESSTEQKPVAGSEVETLKNQITAEKEKYVRLLAEFDNMRKRHERDRQEIIKYAHEEVIIECLKLYDNLERSLNAFKSAQNQDPNLVKGLEMVFNNMKDLMNKYAVKPIESVGKPFDPNSQEVLMQQETTEHPDQTVIEEFEKGYTLGGRVVRTAKVKVGLNKRS